MGITDINNNIYEGELDREKKQDTDTSNETNRKSSDNSTTDQKTE